MSTTESHRHSPDDTSLQRLRRGATSAGGVAVWKEIQGNGVIHAGQRWQVAELTWPL